MTGQLETEEAVKQFANELEQSLTGRYGSMLTGEALYSSLGYSGSDALRQAINRNQVPIPVFSIEHRRGKFALTKDVALWQAQQRFNNQHNKGR